MNGMYKNIKKAALKAQRDAVKREYKTMRSEPLIYSTYRSSPTCTVCEEHEKTIHELNEKNAKLIREYSLKEDAYIGSLEHQIEEKDLLIKELKTKSIETRSYYTLTSRSAGSACIGAPACLIMFGIIPFAFAMGSISIVYCLCAMIFVLGIICFRLEKKIVNSP